MDIHHTEAVIRDAVLRGCVAVAMSIAFHHGAHAQNVEQIPNPAPHMAPTIDPFNVPGPRPRELPAVATNQPTMNDAIGRFCAGDMECEIEMRTLAVRRIQKAVVRKAIPLD